jgi:hypothetical protein
MLKAVLKVHSVAAASYAVVLLFFPAFFWRLTAKGGPSTGSALAITQLLGAAMVLIALVTWIASGLDDARTRRRFAMAILTYLGTGLVVTLGQQLQGKWGPGGWSSPGSYLLFALIYATALLRRRKID